MSKPDRSIDPRLLEAAKAEFLRKGFTDASIREICASITGQKHEMICINDPEEAEDVEKLSAALREAFDRLLPEKCSFEKE